MFNRINKFNFKYLSAVTLLVIISLFFTSRVNAASLSFSPNQATVSVGNIVSLKVIASTDNKSINNAEASIQFPTDMLEVVSISKSSSIFTLWVEEPNFSNVTGKISFNGGLPNPGYTGQSGNIATITFKAKKTGTASVVFTDGSIRANDGLGTDILNSKNSGTIQIGIIKEIDIPTTPSDKNIAPVKPIVISDTHPNQDVWYKNDTANFSWKIPNVVTSIKTLFNKDPIATPTIIYDNSVTQKTFNNLPDGISYFHLRFFNSVGGSTTTHYKVKIDKTSPKAFSPTIKNINGKDLIKLKAEDVISGIDYYTIQIDNNPILKVNKDDLINNEDYVLPIQKEGFHDLIIYAYDKAGNYTEARTSYNSAQLTPPILSLSSNEINNGESVIISGKTDYSDENVKVILEIDGKEVGAYEQKTSSDGSFSVTTDKLRVNGVVNIWAEIVFTESIKSSPSQKVYLKINENPVVRVALSIVFPLLYLIVIIVLLMIILISLYWGWHKYFGLKKKIHDEAKQTTIEIHKAMLLLKEELNEQLLSLEKIRIDRNLNEKEEVIFREIKDNIDGIESFIEKKLKKLI